MRKHLTAIPILAALVLSLFAFAATASASEGIDIAPGDCDTISAGGESATVCAPTTFTRYGTTYDVTGYTVVTAGGSYEMPRLKVNRHGDMSICYDYVVYWDGGRFSYARGVACVNVLP